MLTHLRKERFPKGEYNKLVLKNIGPCKILRKFSTKGYELELLVDMGLFPIFNVVDLYPYKGNVTEAPKEIQKQTAKWRQ